MIKFLIVMLNLCMTGVLLALVYSYYDIGDGFHPLLAVGINGAVLLISFAGWPNES